MTNPIETVPGVVERLRKWPTPLHAEAADIIEQLAARLDAVKAPVEDGERGLGGMIRDGWVRCPICGEDDMAQTREKDEPDLKLISCLNHGCPSNNVNSRPDATLSPAPLPEATASLVCNVESNLTGCLHPQEHQGSCGYSERAASLSVGEDVLRAGFTEGWEASRRWWMGPSVVGHPDNEQEAWELLDTDAILRAPNTAGPGGDRCDDCGKKASAHRPGDWDCSNYTNADGSRRQIGHASGCVKINCAGCGTDFYSTDYSSPPPTDRPDSVEVERLVARLEYIIGTDPIRDRIASRGHLTNHDLRMCIAALSQRPADGGREAPRPGDAEDIRAEAQFLCDRQALQTEGE